MEGPHNENALFADLSRNNPNLTIIRYSELVRDDSLWAEFCLDAQTGLVSGQLLWHDFKRIQSYTWNDLPDTLQFYMQPFDADSLPMGNVNDLFKRYGSRYSNALTAVASLGHDVSYALMTCLRSQNLHALCPRLDPTNPLARCDDFSCTGCRQLNIVDGHEIGCDNLAKMLGLLLTRCDPTHGGNPNFRDTCIERFGLRNLSETPVRALCELRDVPKDIIVTCGRRPGSLISALEQWVDAHRDSEATSSVRLEKVSLEYAPYRGVDRAREVRVVRVGAFPHESGLTGVHFTAGYRLYFGDLSLRDLWVFLGILGRYYKSEVGEALPESVAEARRNEIGSYFMGNDKFLQYAAMHDFESDPSVEYELSLECSNIQPDYVSLPSVTRFEQMSLTQSNVHELHRELSLLQVESQSDRQLNAEMWSMLDFMALVDVRVKLLTDELKWRLEEVLMAFALIFRGRPKPSLLISLNEESFVKSYPLAQGARIVKFLRSRQSRVLSVDNDWLHGETRPTEIKSFDDHDRMLRWAHRLDGLYRGIDWLSSKNDAFLGPHRLMTETINGRTYHHSWDDYDSFIATRPEIQAFRRHP